MLEVVHHIADHPLDAGIVLWMFIHIGTFNQKAHPWLLLGRSPDALFRAWHPEIHSHKGWFCGCGCMGNPARVGAIRIFGQDGIQNGPAGKSRIITLAKIGIEGVTIDEAVTGSQVVQRLVDTVRVDTVDRLPHAVLDHEAEYQSLDILVDADRDLQSDPCSGFYHLYGAALVIQQDYIGDTGFAGTRDGAYLVIGHSLLDDDTVLTLGEHGAVEIHYLLWRPSECHTAAGQQDGAVADALDRLAIVGDNQQGGPRLAELPDAVEALVLKVGVSHGKSLVDNQDIRAAGCGDAEGQAHLHAAGVGAHRLVDVLSDLRKGDDVRHQRR